MSSSATSLTLRRTNDGFAMVEDRYKFTNNSLELCVCHVWKESGVYAGGSCMLAAAISRDTFTRSGITIEHGHSSIEDPELHRSECQCVAMIDSTCIWAVIHGRSRVDEVRQSVVKIHNCGWRRRKSAVARPRWSCCTEGVAALASAMGGRDVH